MLSQDIAQGELFKINEDGVNQGNLRYLSQLCYLKTALHSQTSLFTGVPIDVIVPNNLWKFRANLGKIQDKIQENSGNISRGLPLVITVWRQRKTSDVYGMKDIFLRIKTNEKTYQGAFIELISLPLHLKPDRESLTHMNTFPLFLLFNKIYKTKKKRNLVSRNRSGEDFFITYPPA